MLDPSDPSSSTPEERTREIAVILARGYLRLRAMGLRDAPTPPPTGQYSPREDPRDTPESGLDTSTRESVYGERVNAREGGPERGNA